jgi:hypothetical protein
MSREQKVAAVEAYLDCFRTKDLSKVALADRSAKAACLSEFRAASRWRPESKRPDMGRPVLAGTAGLLRHEAP